MKTGVLVMMDALGFKGIWNREKPNDVITKMVRLKRQANANLDKEFRRPNKTLITERPGPKQRGTGNFFASVDSVFISDTVVVGFAVKDIEATLNRANRSNAKEFRRRYRRAKSDEVNPWRRFAITYALEHVAPIIAMAAKKPVSLAFRGCISYGDFDVRDNFIIGKAVDEAASMMELAQGAFVWLTPSALGVFNSFTPPLYAPDDPEISRTSRVYLPWKVPLKGGDGFDTVVVSPYFNATNAKQRDSVTQSILKTFTGPLDVMVKKQNTKMFLDKCQSLWRPGRAGSY